MTQHKLLTQCQFVHMPWKNGKGKTLELLRGEDKQGLIFRISQATVAESGHFSDFTGLDRTLVLIKGKGMRLSHHSVDAARHHDLVHLLDIARFDGGDLTSSALIDGAIEDLNIMVRAKDHKARVQAITAPCEALKKTDQVAYFYANEVCHIALDYAEQRLMMPKESFLIMAKSEGYGLRSGSGVLIVIQARHE